MPKIKYLKDAPNAKKGDIKNIESKFAIPLVALGFAEHLVIEDSKSGDKSNANKTTKGKYKTKVVKPEE